jgi:hypothetical protein
VEVPLTVCELVRLRDSDGVELSDDVKLYDWLQVMLEEGDEDCEIDGACGVVGETEADCEADWFGVPVTVSPADNTCDSLGVITCDTVEVALDEAEADIDILADCDCEPVDTCVTLTDWLALPLCVAVLSWTCAAVAL